MRRGEDWTECPIMLPGSTCVSPVPVLLRCWYARTVNRPDREGDAGRAKKLAK